VFRKYVLGITGKPVSVTRCGRDQSLKTKHTRGETEIFGWGGGGGCDTTQKKASWILEKGGRTWG